MKVPSEYIKADNHLQNLRREASDNAINLFKLELESKEENTLYMTDFGNLYEKYHQKACQQLMVDCVRFVQNCPGMNEEMIRNIPRHLRKLKDEMIEFRDAVEKIYELKGNDNFERLLFYVM